MANTQYLPAKEADLVGWAQNFATVFAANPTSVGQTAAVATQMTTKTNSFVSAMTAWTEPATRTPIALETKRAAKSAMIDFVRPLVRQIQAFPGLTDAQRASLRITIPKIPSPPGNPGTPSGFKAELTAIGALNLSWKCTNPTPGTVYQIYRTIDGGTPAYIGGSGNKKFTDASVPAGAGKVTYQIQGVRPTGAGAWATFDVQFGVAPGGTTIESVKQSPVKIAA